MSFVQMELTVKMVNAHLISASALPIPSMEPRYVLTQDQMNKLALLLPILEPQIHNFVEFEQMVQE